MKLYASLLLLAALVAPATQRAPCAPSQFKLTTFGDAHCRTKMSTARNLASYTQNMVEFLQQSAKAVEQIGQSGADVSACMAYGSDKGFRFRAQCDEDAVKYTFYKNGKCLAQNKVSDMTLNDGACVESEFMGDGTRYFKVDFPQNEFEEDIMMADPPKVPKVPEGSKTMIIIGVVVVVVLIIIAVVVFFVMGGKPPAPVAPTAEDAEALAEELVQVTEKKATALVAKEAADAKVTLCKTAHEAAVAACDAAASAGAAMGGFGGALAGAAGADPAELEAAKEKAAAEVAEAEEDLKVKIKEQTLADAEFEVVEKKLTLAKALADSPDDTTQATADWTQAEANLAKLKYGGKFGL